MKEQGFIRALVVMVLVLMPPGLWAQTEEDHYNAGYRAYQAGDWSKAVSELTNATQMNASYWEAYQLLSYASYKNHDVKQAISYGETSLALYPHNPKLRNFVGRLKNNSMPEPPDQDSPMTAPEGDKNPEIPPVISGGKSDVKVNSIYLNLGLARAFAPDDFSNYWGSGAGVGAGYGIGVSRQFSIILDIHYSSMPWTYTVPGVTNTGGGIHLLSFLANGKFDFTDRDNPVVLYGLVGLGPTALTFDSFSASGPGGTGNVPGFTETDLGLRLALGIDVRMGQGVYLTVESNGIDTFTSEKVTSEGYITNSLLSLGLRIDTK